MRQNIRVVLVETSHPGNIGAVARAMKNMCLDRLVLVEPKCFPCEESSARASGADDVLDRARVVESLEAAVADCRLVIGASARRRTVDWPQLDPRACAERVLEQARAAPVALVFGRESSGLTNHELSLCRYLMHIPANPDYSSLNLAMAVQIVAYELMMATAAASRAAIAGTAEPASSAEQMSGLFAHLEQALVDIGFMDPRHSGKLMQRLKRVLHRAQPDPEDINILRGILSAAQGRKSMRREPPRSL
jgi:tRNA (cytidine32/uridine32-2'-O)-methyltransferase